jgi:hypothetical protein
MLGNEAFDRERIAQAHRTATIRRMTEYGGTILAVQDTTGVNYDNHLKTEGIGYISDKTLAVNIHTCLAVTVDGLVLGVLDQSSYNRLEAKDESATHDSKKIRPIEEKESYRSVVIVLYRPQYREMCAEKGRQEEARMMNRALRPNKPAVKRLFRGTFIKRLRRVLKFEPQ